MQTMLEPTPARILSELRVMYVEDDIGVQSEMSAYLRRRFPNIQVAENGEQGLATFERLHPDVVVTDISMPGMNGLEMARRIRIQDDGVPIIFVSAHDDFEYLSEAIQLGIKRYITKPTDPEELARLILLHGENAVCRKRAEGEMRFAKFILDAQPNFVVSTSDTNIEYINRTLRHHLDRLSEERGAPVHLEEAVSRFNGEAYRPGDGESWWRRIAEGPGDSENVVSLRDGWDEESDSPFVVSHSSSPELGKHIFSFAKIARLDSERKALKKLALTDTLTGIPNRLCFERSLKYEIKRARLSGSRLSMLIFDVDHFKQINDEQGHAVGDRCLIEIVRRVCGVIRRSDLLARWGGDEFVLLAPGANAGEIRALGEKLRAVIAAGVPEVGDVTGSFGCATLRESDAAEDLFARADAALYRAKDLGRNRVIL